MGSRAKTSPRAAELPTLRLDRRVAVITGASRGIGRAFAEAFALAGARVVLAGRSVDALETVRQAIEASGGAAEVCPTDVTRLGDLRNLAATVGQIARAEEALVLVNNAGIGFTRPALETGEEDLDRILATHVKATFQCNREFAPLMIERGYGKIINMTSTWAATTDMGKAAYGAAKAAVSQMTRALSTEWAPLGIRVNALAPTTTLTEFTAASMRSDPERAERLRARIKLGRFAETADLVGPALFLASAASDFVTGHVLQVDGGWTAGG